MHCNNIICVEHYNRVRLIFREIKGTKYNNGEGNHECVCGESEVTSRSAVFSTHSVDRANKTVKSKVANSRRKIL
jgi:hypothetical protein